MLRGDGVERIAPASQDRGPQPAGCKMKGMKSLKKPPPEGTWG